MQIVPPSSTPYPKNNLLCFGSGAVVAGRPLFLSPVFALLASGVLPLDGTSACAPSACTASRMVCRDRQRSICSLNARSFAVCGRLQMGQSHSSSSGWAGSSLVGLGTISFPWWRYGDAVPSASSESTSGGRPLSVMPSSVPPGHCSHSPSSSPDFRFKAISISAESDCRGRNPKNAIVSGRLVLTRCVHRKPMSRSLIPGISCSSFVNIGTPKL